MIHMSVQCHGNVNVVTKNLNITKILVYCTPLIDASMLVVSRAAPIPDFTNTSSTSYCC